MNNYLFNLPEEIIIIIYKYIHKYNLSIVLKSLKGRLLWRKIRLYHYFPLYFCDNSCY